MAKIICSYWFVRSDKYKEKMPWNKTKCGSCPITLMRNVQKNEKSRHFRGNSCVVITTWHPSPIQTRSPRPGCEGEILLVSWNHIQFMREPKTMFLRNNSVINSVYYFFVSITVTLILYELLASRKRLLSKLDFFRNKNSLSNEKQNCKNGKISRDLPV